MKEILFKLGLFGSAEARPSSERVLAKSLDLLYTADVEYLRRYPQTPSIYTPGVVRYVREPIPAEVWKTIPYIIEDGFADCEDSACARSSELLVHDGIDAKPVFSFRKIGNLSIYHIVVRHPDGTIEDPSKRLGMV